MLGAAGDEAVEWTRGVDLAQGTAGSARWGVCVI